MQILEYDDVDPLKVMHLNQMALDFSLSPELVARIRQRDPRPFPCLAIYAVEDGSVVGQVGIFRLPMISTAGREDVGGLWAVCTHPEHSGRGVASALIEAAHDRMRAAGLRFSTLGTDRYRTAYGLYQKHGYEETNIWAAGLARWETAHQPTRLRAKPAGPQGYDLVENIYAKIAKDFLGFACRPAPSDLLRRAVDLADLWVLRENRNFVGYAIADLDRGLLKIASLALEPGVDAAEAVAALAAEVKSAYVQVRASRPVEVASLRRAGFEIAHPTWSSFMVKPLTSSVSSADAINLFGIGSDRFLISYLDPT